MITFTSYYDSSALLLAFSSPCHFQVWGYTHTCQWQGSENAAVNYSERSPTSSTMQPTPCHCTHFTLTTRKFNYH